MSDYPWTDDALYALVKDLPDDARAEHGQWVGEPPSFLVVGRYMPLAVAVALHEAGALRWLAAQGDETDYVCLSVDEAGTWIETPWEDGHYPTTLHALVAAIRSAGAGGGDSEGGAG